jgi:hypothetical protein
MLGAYHSSAAVEELHVGEVHAHSFPHLCTACYTDVREACAGDVRQLTAVLLLMSCTLVRPMPTAFHTFTVQAATHIQTRC